MRALVEHERLGTDLGRRVDIFGIIERARIWLMFQPMRSVYGAYDRQEDAAGILIHSGHPFGLQRFTGAHEFGHHVLGHTGSVDDAAQIEPGSQDSDPQEAAAQTFASEFLMPLELVNAVSRRLGLPSGPSPLSGRQVYEFSLEVGVSYAAAISRLVGLRRLTPDHARRLRLIQPQQIKREIGGGIAPLDARADVWMMDLASSGRELTVKTRDEIHVVVPDNPSTGYIWMVDSPDVPDIRADDRAADSADSVLDMAYVGPAAPEGSIAGLPADDLPIGVGGECRFVFRALRPGAVRLRLAQRRPWQRNAEARTVEASIEVTGRLTGDAEMGLSERQKPFLA